MRRLGWVLAVLGIAAVVLVGFTGYQALKARTNLQLVADDFETLAHQLTAGDQSGAQQTLKRTQAHARKAHDSTMGPGWWLTSRLPGVGRNVVAVRTVADVADELSTRVLPDVVEAVGALEPESLRPSKGRVDLAPISAAAPAVVRADSRLARQSERVQAIDSDALAPQIAGPVRELQHRLSEASGLSDRLSRAVRLLPPMLGANGERTYLLIFQNNAEIRATGGIPGSFATVTARNGKVALGRQGEAATIGKLAKPPIPLTAGEKALFGTKMGLYPQDVNFTPDFPRSARLISAMLEETQGTKVDGVVSTDPVALSYLLRGTGPVELAGGRRLTADDAVSMLLSDVYAEITDPRRQNVYFDSVAKSVFDAVASGQGEPRTVLKNLAAAVGERRILLWSRRPAEQALISPTALSGKLPTKATDRPQVGVYLNDGGASKLDYYLGYDVDVESTRCQATRQFLTVTVHLRSRVPKHTSTLPSYVVNHTPGLPPAVIHSLLYVYAPVEGYFDRGTVDGKPTKIHPITHEGRMVVAQTVDVEPGGERTLTFDLATGKGRSERTELQVTPGVRGDGIGSVSGSAC